MLLNERDIHLQDFNSSIRGEIFCCRPAWGTHQRPPAGPSWVSGENNNLSFGMASLPRALTAGLVLHKRLPELFLIIPHNQTYIKIRNSHHLIPDISVNLPQGLKGFFFCCCNVSLLHLFIQRDKHTVSSEIRLSRVCNWTRP